MSGQLAPGSGYNAATGIYTSKQRMAEASDYGDISFVEYLFSQHKDRDQRRRVAVVDGTSRNCLTYEELFTHVRALASGFAKMGVRKGSHVLVLLPNTLEYSEIVLATLLLGGTVTTFDPHSFTEEVEAHLDSANLEIALLCTTVTYAYNIMQRTKPQSKTGYLETVKVVIVEAIELDETTSWVNTVAPGPTASDFEHPFSKRIQYRTLMDVYDFKHQVEHVEVPVRLADPALVLLSLGTGATGFSHGVVLTHGDLMAFVRFYCGNELNAFHRSDVFACAVPQFHMYGLVVVTLGTLARGSTLVVLQSRSGTSWHAAPTRRHFIETLLQGVEQYLVSHLPVTTSMLRELLDEDLPFVRKFNLKRLRRIYSSGSAIVSREAIQRLANRFPHVQFLQDYGFAETTGLGAGFPAGIVPRSEWLGSVGLLSPCTEAKIVFAEEGLRTVALPPCFEGELWLRGPGVMAGYLKNPKATAEVLDNEGWFHTTDTAYFNEDGFLYIVGRNKLVIYNDGAEVGVMEIETRIREIPKVQDALVIPVAAELTGQVAMALVTMEPDANIQKFYITQNLPLYGIALPKLPLRIEFSERLLKSHSGEPLRDDITIFVRNAGLDVPGKWEIQSKSDFKRPLPDYEVSEYPLYDN